MDDIDPVPVHDAAHTEMYPGTYEVCMNTPGFPRTVLMKVLKHITANKATAIQFVKMSQEDRNQWIADFLEDHKLIM